MSSINVLTATGRLGADAELTYSKGGKAIWKARVAVDYGYGDNKGTNWITVLQFDKRAESLGNLYLLKGASIGFSGPLQVKEYDKKDGSKGTSVEVVANDVALLSGKSDAPREQNAGPRNAELVRQEKRGGEFPEDDIPF